MEEELKEKYHNCGGKMPRENPYKNLSDLEVCKRYILSILDSVGCKDYGAADSLRTELHIEICRRLKDDYFYPVIINVLWDLNGSICFSFSELRRKATSLDYDEWRPIREKARDTYGEALYNALFVRPIYCVDCLTKLKEGFCEFCDLRFIKAKLRKKMIEGQISEIRERVFANVNEEDKDCLLTLDMYNSAERFWNFVLERGLCAEYEYKIIKNRYSDLWSYVGD